MIQIQSGVASIVEGKLHRGNEPKQFVYLHGGDIRGAAETSGRNTLEILDFSANINPLGMPPGVREAIIESLDSSLRRRCPKSLASRKTTFSVAMAVQTLYTDLYTPPGQSGRW